MFLKRYERHKNGKGHTYWALVESVRTARGSRHRVVAYLGELRRSEQNGWAKLGRKLSRRRAADVPLAERPAQRLLFDPPEPNGPSEVEELAEEVLVRLKDVRLERLRDFGDVWLAWGLWRLLGLDIVLGQRMPSSREDVAWPLVAAILVIARFCEPTSELHIEDTWYRRTALEDLLEVPVEKVHTDRLYAGLDLLLPHKEALEKYLRDRLGYLFDLEYDLLLYDMTSTYFEGQCAGNPLAQRGYSRDSRPDCKQVCIGLVVTTDGIPLGYEVFAGNRGDSTTVKEVIESMERKYGRANRVWVMDRGMVSEENLTFLRRRGGSYIVGTPKAMLRQFERYLVDRDWHEVQAGVEAKFVPAPEGEETFILARSADRRQKEQAIHERFTRRMEAGLAKMATSAENGRLKDEGQAQRRLGRLQTQNWRASKAFDVKIERLDPPQGKARLRVTWTPKRALRRVESTGRRLLPAAEQPDGDRSGHLVEAVHPTD
jgi:hypothetical protein